MNEAAAIQKESKYPLDVIRQFRNVEQYEICKDAGLVTQILAILTKHEHMLEGNNKIWHIFGKASEAHASGNKWAAQRKAFWRELAAVLAV